DPTDPQATLAAVRGWLGGAPLDFLWLQGPWVPAEALGFVASYVPELLLGDRSVAFPYDGRLRLLGADEACAWARAGREMARLREQCTAHERLEDAAGAAPELVQLLKTVQQRRPGAVCVLGSADPELLCLLARAAGPGAKLLAAGDYADAQA